MPDEDQPTPSTTGSLAIRILIEARCRELGISNAELVKRLGYRNISKGLRRLDRVLAGDFANLGDVVRHLPEALGIPAEVATRAVRDTRAVKEDIRRSAFTPHGVIQTGIQDPRPIFVVALTGASKWTRIDFDLTRGPSTFLSQALGVVKHRREMFGDALPMFGRVMGFIINYSHDLHVRYDLHGRKVDAQPCSIPHHEASFSLAGGRSLKKLIRFLRGVEMPQSDFCLTASPVVCRSFRRNKPHRTTLPPARTW